MIFDIYSGSGFWWVLSQRSNWIPSEYDFKPWWNCLNNSDSLPELALSIGPEPAGELVLSRTAPAPNQVQSVRWGDFNFVSLARQYSSKRHIIHPNSDIKYQPAAHIFSGTFSQLVDTSHTLVRVSENKFRWNVFLLCYLWTSDKGLAFSRSSSR